MVATSKKKPKHRDQEPLDVHLTVRYRFGDEADDEVTMMENRRIPMVGSVFEKRDVLARNFVKLLLHASTRQPKVLRELIPVARLLRRDRS